MLFFHLAEEHKLSAIRREGLSKGVPLLPSLEAARRQRDQSQVILAIAAEVFSGESHPRGKDIEPDGGSQASAAVPAECIENLDPYLPPEAVVAAGGYVLRADTAAEKPLEERPLLLIRKRKVWDLPKGKQDLGESVRQCALREVREETGLKHVHLLGALGPTVHGYRERSELADERYVVKTTHWFLMETPETELVPQRGEGIEEAIWITWKAAGARLGYETLKRHHRHAAPAARAILEGEAMEF